MDGLFADYELVKRNIVRSLKRNRKVSICYIYQDPLKAWEFTKKREKLEGRFVPPDIFVRSFFAAKDNVNRIKQEFKEKVIVNLVKKDYENKIKDIKSNIDGIDNFLEMPYNELTLREKICD